MLQLFRGENDPPLLLKTSDAEDKSLLHRKQSSTCTETALLISSDVYFATTRGAE
jgi:hypothetical protein